MDREPIKSRSAALVVAQVSVMFLYVSALAFLFFNEALNFFFPLYTV